MRFLKEKAAEEEYCKPAGGVDKAQIAGGQGCSGNALIFESVRRDKEAERKLEVLAYGEVINTEPLFVGESQVYIVTLKSREKTTKAIFKYGSHFTGRGEDSELAAVALSQTLGFGVAPLGLLRTIGRHTGFIQEFIDGEPIGQFSNPTQTLESDEHYQQYNLIKLFDYVIGNHDRLTSKNPHLGNWLVGKDGTLHAIDHSEAFAYHASSSLGLVRDKQIPLKAAEKIIQAEKNGGNIDALIAHFPFFLRDGSGDVLKTRIQNAARSITIKSGKAFVDQEKLTTY